MADGNFKGPLPEKVWRELEALLNPAAHTHGEFKIVIRDSKVVSTEKVTRRLIASTDN